MIKIHHLNCGSMCPVGGRLMDGFSKGFTSYLACHCLALETDQGLVLIDTGFGTEDVVRPLSRLSGLFINLNNIKFDMEHTALRQLERLGFQREDVRHIVLTHLDFDHAGGISDFPSARVHVISSELEAARNASTWLAQKRYRHQQWEMEKNWVTYNASGEKWFGFESVRNLEGLPPEILMVSLIGHTRGHAGIAIHTADGWLLHAGDAYFYRGEMDPDHYHCTPGLRFYQRMMEVDRNARLNNQRRLRELIKSHNEVQIFSAHDALEMLKYAPSESIQPHPSSQGLAWT
jgi:glyoxylase-like metal-dependent hydrolase (beta-lactamase superfamily II)